LQWICAKQPLFGEPMPEKLTNDLPNHARNWLLALSFLTQIVLGVERSQITLNALITPTTNSV
jgi:hypothetical protein